MLRQSRCHSHCVPFGVNAVLVAAAYTLADEALASAVSLWPRQHRCLGAALDDREKARAAKVAPPPETVVFIVECAGLVPEGTSAIT